VSHPVCRRPRRRLAMAKVKNIARALARATPGATRTRIPDIRHAHARVHVIRSAVATSRDIGEYMPAAADLLVVNLARESFLESAFKQRTFRWKSWPLRRESMRGAGSAVNHVQTRCALNACARGCARASATSRPDSAYRTDLTLFPSRE